MYWVIRQKNTFFDSSFEDADKLALLLACIGHDLNHPGLGNTYFQKANHSISQTVNGKSVLENFHCYTLFRLFDET